MLNSRQLVRSCIEMRGIDRLPRDFGTYYDVGPRRLPPEYGNDFNTDFLWTRPDPFMDERFSDGVDEWGCVWRSIGIMGVGEVKEFPLKNWDDFDPAKVPDARDPQRWKNMHGKRAQHPDKFIVGRGVSLFERIHFLRGLEETWVDIYENPEQLRRLIDTLVDMNLYLIERYAQEDLDAMILYDDWGLQNQLMISPDSWRSFWKPAYARIFDKLHQVGMKSILHSCGNILAILDELIEIGLDVIQMDQQENMGLELLGERFSGRITFFAPVDIQGPLVRGNLDEIRAYCRRMVNCLSSDKGGFIPKWYVDPAGAGQSKEAVDAMCDEFMAISRELYGAE